MPLPYGLGPKDVVGPIVSAVGAVVSVVFACRNVQMAKSNGTVPFMSTARNS